MQHRDYIVIQKVLSEIDVGQEMLGDIDHQDFMKGEKLKRAVFMTFFFIVSVINGIIARHFHSPVSGFLF